MYHLYLGDAWDILPTLQADSIDSVVTDPPYGYGFMGKDWDKVDTPFRADFWREVKRVLKPGGHALVFGGDRTFHRTAVALEDAGFELRHTVLWLYGSGFPKSHDISKAIDKAAGVERKTYEDPPVTDAACQWEGWGTALKPAAEYIAVVRKPLSGRNVAANVLRWGTGALNVDATRIETNGEKLSSHQNIGNAYSHSYKEQGTKPQATEYHSGHSKGRYPANVIHDGSDEMLEAFAEYGDGTASRFFYSAKASRRDRDCGGTKTSHPTVKPLALMSYLCRLVTPPGGYVLDPFAGSGTTLQAAAEEGFKPIGIEREPEYQEDIRRRMEARKA